MRWGLAAFGWPGRLELSPRRPEPAGLSLNLRRYDAVHRDPALAETIIDTRPKINKLIT